MTVVRTRRDHRRRQAAECFRNARESIGTIEPDMSLFMVTRGQFSMIDAILACLDETGPARISCWTFAVAAYECEVVARLREDERITAGTLVVAMNAGTELQRQQPAEWRRVFGPDSVKFARNHAKMATLEGGGYRLLLRGSMNLNANPQFEQLDITEGGPEFALVRRIEDELPVLREDASNHELLYASRIGDAWHTTDTDAFREVRQWRP